jgi:hypothetical protein
MADLTPCYPPVPRADGILDQAREIKRLSAKIEERSAPEQGEKGAKQGETGSGLENRRVKR